MSSADQGASARSRDQTNVQTHVHIFEMLLAFIRVCTTSSFPRIPPYAWIQESIPNISGSKSVTISLAGRDKITFLLLFVCC